jgi:hypothetical protein
MRRLVICLIALMAVAMSAGYAQAESWIFGRSYYSHTPPRPIVVGQPQSRGGPYYSRPQGEFTTSSLRYLRSYINIQGQTVDQYMVYESYIQGGSQF